MLHCLENSGIYPCTYIIIIKPLQVTALVNITVTGSEVSGRLRLRVNPTVDMCVSIRAAVLHTAVGSLSEYYFLLDQRKQINGRYVDCLASCGVHSKFRCLKMQLTSGCSFMSPVNELPREDALREHLG